MATNMTRLQDAEALLREIETDAQFSTTWGEADTVGYLLDIDLFTKVVRFLSQPAPATACGKPSSTPVVMGMDGRKHCTSGPCKLPTGHDGDCTPDPLAPGAVAPATEAGLVEKDAAKRLLEELDMYLDFSEPWENGFATIQDTTAINAVFAAITDFFDRAQVPSS